MVKKPRPGVEYRDTPRNLVDDDRSVVPMDGIEVSEWTPLLNGEGQPTQVHLTISPGEGPLDIFRFVVRLKSKDACDRLIEALQRHRDNVFGVS